MKLKTKLKLIGCGLMVAFATFWTIHPLRNAVIAPGYGTCYKCDMPWKFTRPHFTDVGPWKPVDENTEGITVTGDAIVAVSYRGGTFCLCERCWTKLEPAERLPYYRESFDKWGHRSAINGKWEAIKAAVLAGG